MRLCHPVQPGAREAVASATAAPYSSPGEGEFDMFLTALALATAMPPQPMTAEVTRDPITDRVRARAVLNDNRNQIIVVCNPTEHSGLTGQFPDPVGDLLGISDDRPNIQVLLRFTSWFPRGNIFVGVRPMAFRVGSNRPQRGNTSVGARPMTFRFDSNRPQRLNWYIRDDTAILVGRRRVDSFMQWLSTSERLVIRTRDVEERPVDLTFRVAGAAEAIARVREACVPPPRPERRWWWPF